MQIEKFHNKDLVNTINLIESCKPFIISSNKYSYWMLSNYFSESCFVAKNNNQVVGFISAVPTINGDIIFIWQICIDEKFRGQEIGCRLIEKVHNIATNKNIKSIHCSINRKNISSIKLFEKYAVRKNLVIKKIGNFVLEKNMEDDIYEIQL